MSVESHKSRLLGTGGSLKSGLELTSVKGGKAASSTGGAGNTTTVLTTAKCCSLVDSSELSQTGVRMTHPGQPWYVSCPQMEK